MATPLLRHPPPSRALQDGPWQILGGFDLLSSLKGVHTKLPWHLKQRKQAGERGREVAVDSFPSCQTECWA